MNKTIINKGQKARWSDRLPKIKRSPLRDKELPLPQDYVPPGTAIEQKKLKGLSFWDRRKLKKKPEHSFLIHMIFSNGTARKFIITTNSETFTYKKRTYNLRYEDSLFNLTDNQFELIYHEDFVNPMDKKITRLGDKCFFSTTPENIKPIIEMEYVKALSSSIELNKFFRSSLILSIINLFGLMFILFMMFKINKLLGGLAGVP